MADAAVEYKEIRFVIEDEQTLVYVYINCLGDCPVQLQGWHFKAFPKSIPANDILTKYMFGKKDDCMLWPQDAPKEK